MVALVFVFVGNEWTLKDLKYVLCFGLGCTSIPVLLQLKLSDDQSLHQESESAWQERDLPSQSSDEMMDPVDSSVEGDGAQEQPNRYQLVVPLLLASTDLITAFGAGISYQI